MRYKKQIILFMTISVLFSFSLLVVKASSEIWIQTYGGKGYTEGHFPIFFARTSLVETPEGGYAIASSTNSYGAGEFDFLLIKTDFNGNMLWNKTYGGPEHERASSLVVTSDGGFAIAGSTYTFDEASPDFWLVKTDANGNMEWNKTIGGNREDYAYSMVQTSDGGYALAGITHSFGYYAGWLVKTDSNGNEEWNQTYGGEGDDWISSIVECSDGGFAAVGTIVTSDMASPFFWLVKTDALGNEEWNQTYGREEYQQATAGSDDYAKASSLVTTSDGGFALAGSISDFENGEDFWLVKTDALGNMEWNQRYGGEDSDTAYSVIETPDRGFALCGKKGFANRAPSDFLLVKTDANGNIEWNQTYGGTEHESAHSLVATSDGGFALVGEIKTISTLPSGMILDFMAPLFFGWLKLTNLEIFQSYQALMIMRNYSINFRLKRQIR